MAETVLGNTAVSSVQTASAFFTSLRLPIAEHKDLVLSRETNGGNKREREGRVDLLSETRREPLPFGPQILICAFLPIGPV